MIYDLKYVSPSQITRFDDSINNITGEKRLGCNRKWYFSRVLKIRKPPSPAMRAGTFVHDDIEKYLRQEIPWPRTPEGQKAIECGLMPTPGPHLHVEKRSQQDWGVVLSGLNVKMIIDLVWEPKDRPCPRVQDWKTKSSFSDLMTEAEMYEEPQLNIYGWAALNKLYPDATHIDLAFTYLQRPKDSNGNIVLALDKTILEVERAHISSVIHGRIEPVVEDMKKVARLPIEKVSRNTTACYQYGPCEYMTECFDIPWENDPFFGRSIFTLAEGETMAIDLEKVLAQKEKPNGAAPVVTQPAAPVVTQPAAPVVTQPEPSGPNAAMVSALLSSVDAGVDIQGLYLAADEATRNAFDLEMAKRNVPAEEPEVVEAPTLVISDFGEDVAPATPTPSINLNAVTPPDAAADVTPKHLSEISVNSFDWEQVDGVGPKYAGLIAEAIGASGLSTIEQVLNSFDFTAVSGIGKGTVAKIRASLQNLQPFTPTAWDGPTEIRAAQAAFMAGEDYDVSTWPQHGKIALVNWKKSQVEAGNQTLENAINIPVESTPPNPLPTSELENIANEVVPPQATLNISNATSTPPTTAHRDTVDEAGTPDVGTGLVLCINCTPLKGSFELLDVLLAPLKAEVCAENGFTYFDEAPYNEGSKLLTAKVIRNIQSFDNKIVVADDSTEHAKRVLSVLVGRAHEIIKAL